MNKFGIEKVILIILDGFGLASSGPGNPVTVKTMPFLDKIISSYKSYSLVASGLVVGLEWGNYGNSEVGHGALGTGRVVVQSLSRINFEIKEGKFFKNEAFLKVLKHVQDNHSKVHLIGLVSPGGLHSHEGHLVGLLEFFAQNNFSSVYVHMITDGEDSFRDEGLRSLNRLKDILFRSKAKIATVGGRDFAMDRVKNWPLIKRAWDTIVHASGAKCKSAQEHLEKSYKDGVYDRDVVPASVLDENGKCTTIEDGDGIIFFNFRNDRMRQIIPPFIFEDFYSFERGHVFKNLMVATMTDYDDSFKVAVAYPPEIIPDTLGEIISKKGMRQYRTAEGEKEAHVTSFFNGGKLDPYDGEIRIISPSMELIDKGYLEHPEMRTKEITENILNNLDKPFSLMVVNYASTDMVAHTGNIPAAKTALKVVDDCLKKIITKADLAKTAIIITADHGNIEEMIDPASGGSDTQHSTANVPAIFISDKFKEQSDKNLDNLYKENPVGSLIDVAPTILAFLGIKPPKEMSGSKIVD